MSGDSQTIQPIVLVGGKARRFGRDKLKEPMPGASTMLVDAPISALRQAFGDCVALVGHCDEAVRTRGDLVIEDNYPGIGPCGGVLSALEWAQGDVFVLAGDVPRLSPGVVHMIIHAGAEEPQAWAVLARTGRLEPCIGIYRQPMREVLRARVESGAYSLVDAIPPERLQTVKIDETEAVNVNTPRDLQGLGE